MTWSSVAAVHQQTCKGIHSLEHNLNGGRSMERTGIHERNTIQSVRSYIDLKRDEWKVLQGESTRNDHSLLCEGKGYKKSIGMCSSFFSLWPYNTVRWCTYSRIIPSASSCPACHPPQRTAGRQSSGMTWIIKSTRLENFIPFYETTRVKNQLGMPME